MAPRGRQRKRLKRMDAAVDAMTPFGFSEQSVHKRVKGLLKEYGGDDGWPFIEADAYVLLINSILEEQEEEEIEAERCPDGENLTEDGEVMDERSGHCSDSTDGPSGEVCAAIISKAVDAATRINETGAADAGPSGLDLAPICSESTDITAQSIEIEGNGDEEAVQAMQLDHTPPSSHPPTIPLRPRARRKPCYGWISDDDDDYNEDDLTELTIITTAGRLSPANRNKVTLKNQEGCL